MADKYKKITSRTAAGAGAKPVTNDKIANRLSANFWALSDAG